MPEEIEAAAPAPTARVPILIFAVLVLTLIMVFVAWRGESFARVLTDEEILERLEPEGRARSIQHALSQLEDRLGPTYEGRERFREKVVALRAHPDWEIRRQVAWVMGRDPSKLYRDNLAHMLEDEDVGVRRNAAVALSNFNDPRGLPHLLSTLKPIEVKAPADGVLNLQLEVGDSVSMGRGIGEIRTDDGGKVAIEVPFNGYAERLPVADESRVEEGRLVAVVSPDPTSVLNALTALRAVGRPADVPALRPYANGDVRHMNEAITKAATRAIDTIERRNR